MKARTSAWVAAGAVAAPIITGAGSAQAAASCTRQPHKLSPYALSRSRIAVRVGTTVYVVEGEPEKYVRSPNPTIFPWLPPRSANPLVLSAVRLCSSLVPSHGIPERVFAFRANRVGTATLSAPLASAWRSVKPGPSRFVATVTVRR